MSKSIWEILSPFAKPEPPKEEPKEDAPAEETPEEKTEEDAPTEQTEENTPAEKTEEDTPAEKPEEDTSSENNGETSSEDSGEASPSENAEEAPEQESDTAPLEPLLFRIVHKLMGCKLFMDLCKFIIVILLGITLVLTYGQIRKTAGCASFETIFAHFEANKLCNYFIKGDMEKLAENVHILTPTDGYKKDWESDLRSQIASSLSSLYQEKKIGKLAKKTNITCEYQKDQTTGITHLVYTCHIQITSKEEMTLIFQKDGKKSFQISASSKGKNADTLKQMTNYFTYLSNGYYRASDYSISSLLCQNDDADYSVLSKYFHKNANKTTKKDTLGTNLATRLTSLLSNQVVITNAVFTPYDYNEKTKKLSTCLILCFENSNENSSGILYQPLTVGVYGYAPTDNAKFYSDYMDESIVSQIHNLFAISN